VRNPKHREPRRSWLRRFADRLTPGRLRVWYGPDGRGGYEWECRRCSGRRPEETGPNGGYTRSLAGAQSRAKKHARRHFGMRVVYIEDWSR
jgi:hypothetical protein